MNDRQTIEAWGQQFIGRERKDENGSVGKVIRVEVMDSLTGVRLVLDNGKRVRQPYFVNTTGGRLRGRMTR